MTIPPESPLEQIYRELRTANRIARVRGYIEYCRLIRTPGVNLSPQLDQFFQSELSWASQERNS
jgi:hypothetical protein